MSKRLTKKHKELIKELYEITSIAGLDYKKIAEYEDAAKTPVLESIKNQITRSIVVSSYTFIDESLNKIIIDYYFGKKKTNVKLSNTKKYRNFNYYILENYIC